jgi:hypothetical protein
MSTDSQTVTRHENATSASDATQRVERLLAQRRRPHAMQLRDVRTVKAPRHEVFRFVTESLPARYAEMALGHERFEVVGGGPMRPGAVIDCRERASNQEVHHRYVVQAFEPGRLLYYASQPSKTFIHLGPRVIRDESDTHVYYDLTEDAEGTRVALTIVIQLKRRTQHWLAVATGSTRLWRRHLAEELTNLKTMIEAEQPCVRAGARG